jgi:hypothetical protein
MNHAISAEFEASRQGHGRPGKPHRHRRRWRRIAEAAASIRKIADDLDRHLGRFDALLQSGLWEYEAFVVDGRHVLAELQKVLKNIDERSSRLIFGH